MGTIRKPLQGVFNIVRFNWHFYALALAMLLLFLLLIPKLEQPFRQIAYSIFYLISGITFLSLAASYFIYDLSNLYKMNWMPSSGEAKFIVNVNAGFDETSLLLKDKFPGSELAVLDFYNPQKHTEVSIIRARKAYPPFAGTQQCETTNLNITNERADKIFVFLSAHEIRNEQERILFFKELQRILKPNGQIYVTEHLRDIANFMVYTLGFLHFFSRASWLRVFKSAGLHLEKEIKITPFISTFIIHKNGNSY